MSFIYLRLKRREEAERIARELSERYKDEIVGYDLEECGLYPLSDPNLMVELRDVRKKGGSLSITIPKPIVDYLGLHSGDKILFAVRKKVGKVYVDRASGIKS